MRIVGAGFELMPEAQTRIHTAFTMGFCVEVLRKPKRQF